MEEFFGNLFKKDSETSNETVSKVNINNEDRSIRNLVKRANIGLADKNMYNKIHNLYENITRDYAHNVAKVVYHRNGKRIGVKDTYLLDNLLNQNMFGGNYSGYCDNNIGQCSDSFAGSHVEDIMNFAMDTQVNVVVKINKEVSLSFAMDIPVNVEEIKTRGVIQKLNLRTYLKNIPNIVLIKKP